MLKHQPNKLAFALTGAIVLLVCAVLSVQVRSVASQSVNTQTTDEDFSDGTNNVQSPTAGTLICNSPAVTFSSGLPVDWSSVVTTGPVSWSTTDNVAVCENDYEAGGIAPGACADSDTTNPPTSVPYDTELRTNPFDLTGAISATLEMQWRHRPLNGSVFDIDVSTNGGSSWTNMLNDVAGNPSGNAGDFLSLDLSSLLGSPSVIARFRYYGTDWDWYVHLDDIRVGCEVPPPPEYCTFGQWTPIASLNEARSRTSVSYYEATGHFYVLGGEASGGNRDIPIEEYDVSSNTWINKSLLNTGVSNSGSAAVGDYIYVPGGWNGVAAQDVMQRYDPMADTVTNVAPMPTANYAHAVTALGTDIYVLGGSDMGGVGTTVFIYDTTTDSWSSGAPLPTATHYHAATSDGTYVYVLGGTTSDLNDVQRYDPSTNSWTTLTGMNAGRAGAGAFFDGANLWAVGGGWATYLTGTEYWDGTTWTGGEFVTAGARTIGVAYNGNGRALKAGGWNGNYVGVAETISVVCGPEIAVEPTSVVEEQYTGQIATYPMSISNIGINILDWALINEAPIALSQPAALPEYVSGLYAPSAGAAPSDGSGVVSRGTSNPINPLSSKVRSWNESNGPYFTLFDIESPGIVPSVGTFTGTGAFIGAGEYVNGLSYMIDGSNNLFVVDDTGMLQAQYMADAPPNGETYSGMALDPTTGNVYASSTNVSSSTLYTFDVLTGSAITVGSIINSPGTIALSFDRAGNLFGYDIINDMFMQIDSATGSTSNMVPLPFDANFGQGMGYDSATGLLYILAFNNGTFQAELWTVDTSDPAMPEFAFIGVLGSSVPGGLNQLPWGGTDICNPVDIPWLDVSPTSGTTGAGLSSMVDVTIDATSLVPGVYTSTLCINSNDAVSPVVRVPLTLTIEEAPIIYLPVVFNNYTNYFSGPEQEPNDTSAQANGPLQPGQAYTGFPDDDRDYFSFATHSPGNINVALSNYTGQGGQLQLFYQSTANRVGFDADAPYNITYQGQPGTYFILIFTESGFNNTPYSLVVNAPQ